MSERKLASTGTDISKMSAYRLPEGLEKAALLCVNTYKGTRYDLGDGPANDGLTMAKLLKTYGFPIYYCLNPTKSKFLTFFNHFIKNTSQHLVFYYVGHGTYQTDTSGDETDRNDEAYVFSNGNIIDDDLLKNLSNKNQDLKVTLVSDCCHSGTIWDLGTAKDSAPNSISIGAANDKQTAKQTVVDRLEQGMFTYNTKKLLTKEPELSPKELQTKIRTYLKKYAQSVVVEATNDSYPNEPIFGPKP